MTIRTNVRHSLAMSRTIYEHSGLHPPALLILLITYHGSLAFLQLAIIVQYLKQDDTSHRTCKGALQIIVSINMLNYIELSGALRIQALSLGAQG